MGNATQAITQFSSLSANPSTSCWKHDGKNVISFIYYHNNKSLDTTNLCRLDYLTPCSKGANWFQHWGHNRVDQFQWKEAKGNVTKFGQNLVGEPKLVAGSECYLLASVCISVWSHWNHFTMAAVHLWAHNHAKSGLQHNQTILSHYIAPHFRSVYSFKRHVIFTAAHEMNKYIQCGTWRRQTSI